MLYICITAYAKIVVLYDLDRSHVNVYWIYSIKLFQIYELTGVSIYQYILNILIVTKLTIFVLYYVLLCSLCFFRTRKDAPWRTSQTYQYSSLRTPIWDHFAIQNGNVVQNQQSLKLRSAICHCPVLNLEFN